MKLEYPLLGLLAVQRRTGYDIKKWLTTEGQFLGLDRHSSQIYRELNKMQVDGTIAFDVDVRGGGPDAKVYRLTAAGQDRLRRWIESDYDPPSRFQAPEFVCRLQFTAMLDHARTVELVRAELDFRVLQVLQNRDRDRSIVALDPMDGVDIAAMRAVGEELHRQGMAAVDAWIDWLRHLLSVLEGADHVAGAP